MGGFQVSIQGAAVDPQKPTQSETAGKALERDRFPIWEHTMGIPT